MRMGVVWGAASLKLQTLRAARSGRYLPLPGIEHMFFFSSYLLLPRHRGPAPYTRFLPLPLLHPVQSLRPIDGNLPGYQSSSESADSRERSLYSCFVFRDQ